MKRFTSKVLTAINAAAIDALNTVSGAWGEIELKDVEKETRYRLAKYGEYPVTIDGQEVIQVIDEESGKLMASNFGSLLGKLAMFGKGAPIYEGHADDAGWLRDNPGHRATAIGRIKAIENGEDGIYVRTVFNSDGVDLLKGDAPKYCGHSPRWRMAPIADRPGHYRPVLLWSDALTNNPNMADSHIALNSLNLGQMPQDIQSQAKAGADGETENTTQDTDMKLTPDALKALGFAADAEPSEDEISAAIVKMLAAKAEKQPEDPDKKPENMEALNTAQREITDLKAIRDKAIDEKIDAAVASGKITEADKPKWKDALNTSYLSEADKLDRLMPTVINTESKLPDLGVRKDGAPEAGGIDAINTAVAQCAREKGYDIKTQEGYHAAYQAAKEAKPELFTRG